MCVCVFVQRASMTQRYRFPSAARTSKRVLLDTSESKRKEEKGGGIEADGCLIDTHTQRIKCPTAAARDDKSRARHWHVILGVTLALSLFFSPLRVCVCVYICVYVCARARLRLWFQLCAPGWAVTRHAGVGQGEVTRGDGGADVRQRDSKYSALIVGRAWPMGGCTEDTRT